VAAGSKGAKAYFGSSLVAQVCALLRFTILARLLGPEQLGLAVTLILTAQFFESVSDSGSDRFLIQDRDGDTPRVQRLVHLLAIGRGVFIAVALAVFSVPLARFYHQPMLAGGLIALAISPLIAGFLHFDFRRMQRHKDFAREAAVMLAGEVVGLFATAVAAFVTRDYTAAIWGMIARSLATVAMSWIKAERRYEAGYSAEHARRLAAFATPLMANGLLLFFAAQGDRLLIGNRLGVTELGHYSAVLLLIYYPSQVISRFVQAMHLPLVSGARDDAAERQRRIDDLAAQAGLLAIVQMIGFAIIAPVVVPLLYGRAFHQPALVIALIGILQASRFIRLWPTTEALAIGRSGIVLGNNIVRLIAFPSALAGLWLIGGLVGLTIGFTLGETAAMVTAVILSNVAIGVRPSANLSRVAVFILCCGGVGVSAWAVSFDLAVAGGAAAATLLALGAMAWTERRTLEQAAGLARRLLKRGRPARA